MAAPEKRKKAYRFGIASEKIAALFLRCKGYRIVAERYRNAYGEIDIVAARGKTLIAVEVKARKSLVQCEETITSWKKQKIERAMQGLLAGLGSQGGKITGLVVSAHPNIRFDVVWIAPWQWPRHIQNAWSL
jgi:putative endonuclease